MSMMQGVAQVAAALSDPARVALLASLLDGEATVSELATRLALAQPRVSTHLARLRTVGLVTLTATGRHRVYRVNAGRVDRLLGALGASGRAPAMKPSPLARRERVRDTPLRRARTCYDHLAGVAGVELLAAMQERGWLSGPATGRRGYQLTGTGRRALARRRVDMDAARASRRQFASACLDWTERRPHLGGALGAAVLAALRAGGYLRRRRGGRDVHLMRPLTRWVAG
jgi:DNA-binding transcriptional ArsR family regulator